MDDGIRTDGQHRKDGADNISQIRHQYSTKNITVHMPVLKVLGMLFDNGMQWDIQVEKSIYETRRSLQGLKIIKKHFTTPELLTLITSICYLKLYYGNQVWLLPTLKETLFRALFSQSGQCLEILDFVLYQPSQKTPKSNT